ILCCVAYRELHGHRVWRGCRSAPLRRKFQGPLKGASMSRVQAASPWLAIGACFLVALFEGLDIQSMGATAPKVAPLFHIGPQVMGFILSASTFGLMIGAAVGGWMSDRVGRRAVLLASMTMLGLFSFGTSLATDYQTLLMARLLAGIGLGGV